MWSNTCRPFTGIIKDRNIHTNLKTQDQNELIRMYLHNTTNIWEKIIVFEARPLDTQLTRFEIVFKPTRLLKQYDKESAIKNILKHMRKTIKAYPRKQILEWYVKGDKIDECFQDSLEMAKIAAKYGSHYMNQFSDRIKDNLGIARLTIKHNRTIHPFSCELQDTLELARLCLKKQYHLNGFSDRVANIVRNENN